MSDTDKPKYAHEVARCPQCLHVGLRFWCGSWCCDYCDRAFSASTVMHHNEAFEQGREFERRCHIPATPLREPETIAAKPMCREAKLLMDLAIEAQRTGKMPDLKALSRHTGISDVSEKDSAFLTPRQCPHCGAQTRDPFSGTIVIHDIDQCRKSQTLT